MPEIEPEDLIILFFGTFILWILTCLFKQIWLGFILFLTVIPISWFYFRQYLRKLQSQHTRLFSVLFYGYFIFLGYYFVITLNSLIDIGNPDSSFGVLIPAQVTLLILTITLPLIVLQLSNTYSSRFSIIVKGYWDFWILIIVDIFALIVYLLKLHNSSIKISIPFPLDKIPIASPVLIVAIISYFVLIPYFFNFLTIVRPENQLMLLSRSGYGKLIIRDRNDFDNDILACFDIINDSLSKLDLQTAWIGLERLKDLVENQNIEFTSSHWIFRDIIFPVIEHRINGTENVQNPDVFSCIRIPYQNLRTAVNTKMENELQHRAQERATN